MPRPAIHSVRNGMPEPSSETPEERHVNKSEQEEGYKQLEERQADKFEDALEFHIAAPRFALILHGGVGGPGR